MKALLLFPVIFLALISTGQNPLKLCASTFDKYLTENYSLEKVKSNVAQSYSFIKENDTEAKYRDDSKSWEALIYIQYDKTTKKVKEIQFTAPSNRAYDYLDELEKLGYTYKGAIGNVDVYEHKTKKLGAKLLPGDLISPGLVLVRIYRL
ncbi:MAG: hypothetical protein IH596_06595 [Bacteroidales bacterium]|nr:hypothetical protein [Bacteroidales bacterium]